MPTATLERPETEAALTPKEEKILLLLMGGKTNCAIANDLKVSPDAIERYISDLLEKTQLKSKTQLVQWAAARSQGAETVTTDAVLPPDPPSSLLVIDGHSLAYRVYHAAKNNPNGGLVTSNGIPVNVCRGFLTVLCRVVEQERPDSIAIAFDAPGQTFRHKLFSAYKSNRTPPENDFLVDLGNLKRLLQAIGIALFEVPEYEADDAIAALTHRAVAAGVGVKIYSSDRDLWQLVDDEHNVSILRPNPKEGGYTQIQVAQVKEGLGVLPSQVADYKALCGDPSDKIPGIKGIGHIWAARLLEQYPDLDAIYQNVQATDVMVSRKLVRGHDGARLSLQLAQLISDVPLQAPSVEEADFGQLLEELELGRLRDRVEGIAIDPAVVDKVLGGDSAGAIAFTCSREDLFRSVALVSPVTIANNAAHPCLNNLVVEVSNGSVNFSAFDLSCRIDVLIEDAETQEHGKIFVAAKDFKRVIASLQSEFVTVQVADRVKLVGGTTVMYIGRRSDEYVALPELDSEATKVEIDREALVSAIAQTQVCMSRCPTKPGLNTLHLEGGTNGLEIWAIDGHRGAISIVSSEPCPEISINLYRQHVPHLLRVLKAAGCKTVCLDVRGSYATLYCGNVTLTAKLQEDSYPKLNALFPPQARRTAVLDRSLLVACVRRLRAQNFYRCTIQIDNLDGSISIKTSKGEGEARACEAFFGQLANFSAADEFVADLGYFAAAIESLPCQEISLGFSHGSKLLLIQPLGGSTKHFVHLLVPGGGQ